MTKKEMLEAIKDASDDAEVWTIYEEDVNVTYGAENNRIMVWGE